ncbi:glycosyltransferase family 2 protein [Aliiglaciecola sp. 3_MG-2023]|uniref:glycosyltransferase family 2 protein n=1 Tax=Aliiglaciecola sp. 3_MG-2023 TaxID=3062644 RepID=UPI0026E4577A|nr:glycosyltransferase family 2 protein [Aliiglaciecola sp. 3_MG-2023]MDO6693011.1 glycosyltransferase family 2 protein [Aliiglaciecola sp. 3_MG-2023]
MSHIPISVFIITLNEEKYLKQVLECLQNFDEIVLVDSGSTDNTVEIAKQYGAKVYHQDWLGFAKQKSHAMSLCKNDWVLNIDGDEILGAELADIIQSSVDEQRADAYRLYFEDVFWHMPMSANSKKRSIVRLYNKNKVQFPTDRLVHENVKLAKGAKEKDVAGLVTHHGYHSTEMLMEKQNKYSSLKAQEKFNKGKKPSWLKLCLVFPLMFVKAYVIEGMFLSGRRGLVHAYISAMYGFLKEAKLHELHFIEKHKRNK